MVITSTGTVLVFCEGRKRSRRDSGDVDLLLKRSEDGGRNWSKQMRIHEEGGDAPIRVGNPCPIIEQNGKTIHLLFTRGGGECLFYNSDGGATWSKPVVDKNLPCPACQASMIRLNKKEILFLNPAVHRKGGFHLRSRRNLTLRVSRDDGRTWPHHRVLNKGLAGYSDMAVTKEGKILCVFENGAKDYCEKISLVRIDRAWILAGKDAQEENPPEKKQTTRK